MFTGLTALLDKVAFWFIFTCVCCLIYSVIGAFAFGVMPDSAFIIVGDLIAILWCYFAGTLTILYSGLKKIKSLFEGDSSPVKSSEDE